MAHRARLSAPQPERRDWHWHKAQWTALPAALIMGGDRRMEADTYLADGYGIRLALKARKTGWEHFGSLARVWQPPRLKGTVVSPEFGTPYLAATQAFDLRPTPRKWLSLDQIRNPEDLFVSSGDILVTRSGNVGRATLSRKSHEGVLVSDDLLRIDPVQEADWGWVYAFLRSAQARAMMAASQYGHVVKHLDVGHLEALPVPRLREEWRGTFSGKVRSVVNLRDRGYALAAEAEARFERAVGPLPPPDADHAGFSVRASSILRGRRRMEATFYTPTVKVIRQHLASGGRNLVRLDQAGFDLWLPTRFKRTPAEAGVELLGSSQLFEVNPDPGRRIADGQFGDPYRGRVQKGWILVARSGQVYGLNGSTTLATKAHEDKVVSDHVIRVRPTGRKNAARPGYAHVCLSHPTLGRPLVKALIYGSSIPELEVADLAALEIIRLSPPEEGKIADLAEEASACMAEADIQESALAEEASALIERFMAGKMDDFAPT